jgi:ssDNA-binding Zn-finger/Zn-ribbon topoisomerase 1
MSFFSKLFSKKEVTSSDTASQIKPPKFIKKERAGNGTYEIYHGKDAESAKEFLLTKRVDEAQYYIVVETPEGNWGMDVKGLYLEHLLPFQKNVSSVQVEGHTTGMPDLFGLQMAAKGINDNFIARVECGNCKHQWQEALRYKNITAVRCPKCKMLNKVDSGNFMVY